MLTASWSRDLLNSCEKWIIICALAACTSKPKPAKPPMPAGPSKIIDAHAHFKDLSEGEPAQPSKQMLDDFAAAGVVGAVVHTSGKIPDELKLSDQAPKLIRCAAATEEGPGLTDLEIQIKAGVYRCIKIYLGYVPKYPSDAYYTPFYELAEKLSVPIVFHTGDTLDKMAKVKYADPLGVDEVAVTYPKVKFVIAHLGNPWFHSAAEVVYKNDNVSVDLSALLLDDVSKIDPETVDELIIKPIRFAFRYAENPSKFLFGSDWPLVDIKSYKQAIMTAIPEAHWDKVFHDNAVALFGLN
jgi:predicted TIM-barrel fold metal-dependent hydrolase